MLYFPSGIVLQKGLDLKKMIALWICGIPIPSKLSSFFMTKTFLTMQNFAVLLMGVGSLAFAFVALPPLMEALAQIGLSSKRRMF